MKKTILGSSAALALAGMLGLSGCSVVNEVTAGGCTVLYDQIDTALGQLGTGDVQISAAEVQQFFTDLEAQQPDAYAALRDGTFSEYVASQNIDVQALTGGASEINVGDFITPDNLSQIDQVMPSVIGTMESLGSVCEPK
ncbi:hypothetical protein [Leucobacter sp. 1207-22]|uniref:hypothetical protein n=1 Tax=Leucobacter sp. 1207-22 TaxID=2604456 RepID=UPI0040648BB4